ncbi:MAG TPA: Gfo/Idh/MocA family oxidoreductase [Candidatus Dormibacteraeota bacterium]|nr:Gfo/Idh/MocA family oxidoreductase [Candidatus Dormibacteraeota bacterium]
MAELMAESPGLGIVGSGYMGRTYAACLTRMGTGGRLVAVTGGSRAGALAEEFGCEVEESLESLVRRKDVDAVILATPHSAHLPQTTAAAAAGKHVYVEKPMALNTAECDAMIAACKRARVKLAVNKVLHFREAASAAKKLIDDGAIGDVLMITARYTYVGSLHPDKPWTMERSEGAPFLDWGAHCCDLLRWYTRSEPVLAYARYAGYLEPPYLQTVMAEFAFKSGAMAQVWLSFELPAPGLLPADTYLVVGSAGMIELETFGKVRLGKGDSWELVAEQPQFDFINDPMSPKRLKGFAAQVKDFVEAIAADRDPIITGEMGRSAVEMVEAADMSAASGEAVRLPLR